MDRYECTVCGFVYNPEHGDPTHGVDPGKSFDELPEKWVCPVCGAPKRLFVKKKDREYH
jgi:rubredoxin